MELAEILGVVNVEHFITAFINRRTYNVRIADAFQLTAYLLSMI